MRRSIGLVVGIASIALVAAPVAADTNIEVNFPTFRPDSTTGLSLFGCTLPGVVPSITVNTSIAWKSFPQTLGDRSWAWNLDNLDAGVGFVKDFTDLASSGLIAVDVNPLESPVTGVAYVSFLDPVATTTNWLGRAQLTESGATWRTIDAALLTYTWTRYSNVGAVVESGGSSTIAAFLPTHGVHRAGSAAIAFGCNGSTFALDRFRVGPPGSVTTYDLEGAAATTSISRSSGSITAGETVRLSSTTALLLGGPLDVPGIILQAKAAGATAFTNVQTVTPTNGVVSIKVKPTVNTTYRWFSPGSETIDSSTSPARLIRVAAKVTATAADKTITAGSKVVVTGTVSSAKAGESVVLVRSKATGDTRLATTTVSRTGAYRFSIPLPTVGTWKLAVVSPKSSHNELGRSPTVTITVSKRR